MKSRVQEFAQRIGSNLFSYEDISKEDLVKELKPFVIDRKDGKKGLLTEEVQELVDALNNGDILEVTDAVVDLQYYLYQMISWLEVAGIDFNSAMNAVCDNNDLKYTTSEALVRDWSLAHLLRGNDYDIYSKQDYERSEVLGYDFTVKYYCLKDSEGKVKKAVGHPKVDLLPFIPEKFK